MTETEITLKYFYAEKVFTVLSLNVILRYRVTVCKITLFT